MENWNKYFNENTDDDNNIASNVYANNVSENNVTNDYELEDNLEINQNNDNIDDNELDKYLENENDNFSLTVSEYKTFCDRLSGFNEIDETKAAITYQSYNINPQDVNQNTTNDIVYNLNNAVAEIAYDELHPDLAVLSIKFKSFDDPELRLFWSRIQKWRTSLSKPQDNDEIPVFVITLIEKDSVNSVKDKEHYTILSANIVNPLICYITREIPTISAENIINERDEIMGGNVIKMLLATDFLTFEVRDDIDITNIKAEVLRENEEEAL